MFTDRSSDPPKTSTAVMSRRTALRLGAGTVGAAAQSASLGRGMVRARTTSSPQGEAGEEPNHFALAILKWLVSTIAGPPVDGALEEYQVLTLTGTAQLVMP